MAKLKTLFSSTIFLLSMTAIVLFIIIGAGFVLLPSGSNAQASQMPSAPAYPSGELSTSGTDPQPLPAQEDTSYAVAMASPNEAPALLAQPSGVTYTGDVLADRKVPVAVEVIGQVLEVNVEVGDRVSAGDVLLRIDSVTLEAQRAQALAGLRAAQAQLDAVLLDAEISDVNAAQAALSAAQSAYQRAVDGPTQEDLDMAESQLRQAEAAVKRAQAAYDRVSWNPAIAALPESMQLEQATLAYEAAQSQFDKIAQGATDDVIDGAYAQVVAARAQLDRLLRGATQPQIDAIQAQINQAETGLFLAQLQVDKATVRSPIDGVIAEVNTSAGANVAPGAPIFQVLSNEVKIVIPVEEARLAQVVVGEPATIRVNAYPDRTFAGEVFTVAPELDSATRTADVTVRPTEAATELSPGMFATVQLGE